MNTVTVVINGIEYNLRGKEDERYLSEVAAYVDTKISKTDLVFSYSGGILTITKTY